MTLQAIETRYKGCRFRSRTEARWAVFFDAASVAWQYELEGFELPSGRYLPDFYLPTEKMWVEIKGAEPTAEEIDKCRALRDASEKAVIMLIGPPGESERCLFWGWSINNSGGIRDMVAESDRPFIVWTVDGAGATRLSLAWPWEPRHDIYRDNLESEIPDARPFLSTIARNKNATDAARSARFEFGESGAG